MSNQLHRVPRDASNFTGDPRRMDSRATPISRGSGPCPHSWRLRFPLRQKSFYVHAVSQLPRSPVLRPVREWI